MYCKATKKILAFALCSLLMFGISGCSGETSTTTSQDILSQKKPLPNRTQISVLVKYAFSINSFEKAVEEKFPDIDLVQVGNYTRDIGIEEYKSRLEHGDLTDIVMTWPLDVGEEYWSDRLLDLSGMSFTSKYSISMLNNISKDGKLYYLPGPSQVRGIVYNKTLFKENGWEVPDDFEGFIELCQTIEKTGIRALQLGFANSEVLDTAFVGYNYADYYSSPPDAVKIEEFNLGKTSFKTHFDGALDTFQTMIDSDIFTPDDLKVSYSDREQMLFSRKCAMVEDSLLLARMGYSLTGITDEFALMPFFNNTNNKDEDSDWSRLYMVCYIGLNKDLALPENKEKYDVIMKLMEYISTPEGQNALSADTGAMFSSLIGVPPPNIPEIDELVNSLSHGRYAVFPTLKNAQGALREGLAGMVNGELTKDDVIKMVDAQNISPIVPTPPKKFGTASERFTMIQTGNFVTDAMREYSGADFALFLDNGKDGRYNGKGISASIYEGDVTDVDILRILPDLKLKEKCVLWTVSMTGADLLKTLEYSIPIGNNQTGWFYYFSGLNMEYDPTANMGNRIKKITTSDGKSISTDTLYTIAVMDDSVPADLIKSCTRTEKAIFDIIAENIEANGTIKPSNDNRFIVVN